MHSHLFKNFQSRPQQLRLTNQMNPILTKIRELKQQLLAVQSQQQIQIQNQQPKIIQKKKKVFSKTFYQPSLHINNLNEDVKINRNDYILTERNKQQNQFYNNNIQFKTFSLIKNNRNKNISTTAERIFNSSKSKKQLNFKKTQIIKSSRNKQFKIQKQSKIQSKVNLDFLKPKSQKKISKILTFLNKNKCECQKQQNKQKVKEMKQMSQNYQIIKQHQQKNQSFDNSSQIRQQEQDFQLQFSGNMDLEQLKKEKKFLQRVSLQRFTPIGSAKNSKTSNPVITSQSSQVTPTSRVLTSTLSLRRKSLSNLQKPNPKLYLKKGNHICQMLSKKLNRRGSLNQEAEMIYVKQFDQWVPSYAIQEGNKQELQKFLKFMIGQRKQKKVENVVLGNINLYYH